MRSTLLMICLTVPLCGCGPTLSDIRDLTLEANDIEALTFNAIGREQTIKVTASSPSAPINVHVYLAEHEAAVERKITLGKPPENLLASHTEAEEISLEALVPANKEVVVRVAPASSATANVHLEITN